MIKDGIQMLAIVLIYPLESHKFCAGIAAVQHIQKSPEKW